MLYLTRWAGLFSSSRLYRSANARDVISIYLSIYLSISISSYGTLAVSERQVPEGWGQCPQRAGLSLGHSTQNRPTARCPRSARPHCTHFADSLGSGFIFSLKVLHGPHLAR